MSDCRKYLKDLKSRIPQMMRSHPIKPSKLREFHLLLVQKNNSRLTTVSTHPERPPTISDGSDNRTYIPIKHPLFSHPHKESELCKWTLAHCASIQRQLTGWHISNTSATAATPRHQEQQQQPQQVYLCTVNRVQCTVYSVHTPC